MHSYRIAHAFKKQQSGLAFASPMGMQKVMGDIWYLAANFLHNAHTLIARRGRQGGLDRVCALNHVNVCRIERRLHERYRD